MYRMTALLAFVLLSPPAFAREKVPDVKEALAEWVAAVETGTAEDIVDLYDNRAVMISTFAQLPIIKRAALVGYYRKVVVNSDIRVEVSEQHPRTFGNVAVNSGQYTLSYTEEGEPVVIPARFSFTYVLRGGKWIIVDHHSSRVPKPDDPK